MIIGYNLQLMFSLCFIKDLMFYEYFFRYLNNHKMNTKVKFGHCKVDFEKYKYICLEHFSALLKVNFDQDHHVQTTLRF
jgi:hypothetical protein